MRNVLKCAIVMRKNIVNQYLKIMRFFLRFAILRSSTISCRWKKRLAFIINLLFNTSLVFPYWTIMIYSFRR